MEDKNRPKEVEVENSEGELTVSWRDGHRSVYSLYGLRKNCPCVECRGGHGSMGDFDRSLFLVDPSARPSAMEYRVEDIRQIGNHAIRIYWNDGHSNGMYQWETLRRLCPCEACFPHEERGQNGEPAPDG